LAYRRCELGRARIAHPHGKQRAQHAAAVHGKGGNQVEQDEHDVGAGKLRCERHCRVLDLSKSLGIETGAEPEEKSRCDNHVNGRARERHDQLVTRLLWHLLHAGNAAERPQRHVARLDAIAARGEDVAQLVQKDAQEDEHDKRRALPGGRGAALAIVDRAEPDEEQKERDVDTDRGSANRSKN